MNEKFLNNKKLKSLKFKSLGKNVKISSNVTIIGAKKIKIGNNVRIDDYTILSVQEGFLEIGSNVHIGGQSYLGCAGGIIIKNNVNISQGVKIYSKINDYLNGRKFNKTIKVPVKIFNEVIIGSNSVVIGKCKINTGATVGALSFVKKDLKSWTIYAGNPVKMIKKRIR